MVTETQQQLLSEWKDKGSTGHKACLCHQAHTLNTGCGHGAAAFATAELVGRVKRTQGVWPSNSRSYCWNCGCQHWANWVWPALLCRARKDRRQESLENYTFHNQCLELINGKQLEATWSMIQGVCMIKSMALNRGEESEILLILWLQYLK